MERTLNSSGQTRLPPEQAQPAPAGNSMNGTLESLAAALRPSAFASPPAPPASLAPEILAGLLANAQSAPQMYGSLLSQLIANPANMALLGIGLSTNTHLPPPLPLPIPSPGGHPASEPLPLPPTASTRPARSNDTHTRATGSYASRHQQAEARRRSRINERLEALRKIVPHSERANTTTFLEEVVRYVQGLQRRVVELETRLGLPPSVTFAGAPITFLEGNVPGSQPAPMVAGVTGTTGTAPAFVAMPNALLAAMQPQVASITNMNGLHALFQHIAAAGANAPAATHAQPFTKPPRAAQAEGLIREDEELDMAAQLASNGAEGGLVPKTAESQPVFVRPGDDRPGEVRGNKGANNDWLPKTGVGDSNNQSADAVEMPEKSDAPAAKRQRNEVSTDC